MSHPSRAPHPSSGITVFSHLSPPETDPHLSLQPSKWLDSPDLRPTPVAHRTWGRWTSYLFWFAAAANLSNWYSPTSFMTVGLTMWEALGCHLAGQFIAGVMMALNGRGGAIYHVGFPVLARASFGVFGAAWPVINRIVMSIIWNGVNLVQCGQAIYTMLHAIFPSIARLPNGMAPDDALNTGGMIGFTISWVLLVAGLWFIPVPKLKYYLNTKVPVFVASAIAMLAWTLALAGGLPHSVINSRNNVVLTGSARSWLLARFIFLSWANNSTFIVNAADLQRYTRNPNDAIWGQVVGFPLSNFIIGLVGVIVGATSVAVIDPHSGAAAHAAGAGITSATKSSLVWNPIVYLDMIQTQNYTKGNRAGAFLIALCFAYSGLFSCIVENVLPAGNDLAALYPRKLTIKRSFMVCALLTWACVPWKLMGTATSFIKWLSSYQIFLSAIAGVMLAHYYIVTGGLLAVEPDLYTASRRGVYYYTRGINPRAYIAYVLGIAPNFYGFLGQLGVNITLQGTRFFYFAFPVGLFVSFTSYLLLCIYFPPAFTTMILARRTRCVDGRAVTTDPRDVASWSSHVSSAASASVADEKHSGAAGVFPLSGSVRTTSETPPSSSPLPPLPPPAPSPSHPSVPNKSQSRCCTGGRLCPKFQLRWREPANYVSALDPGLPDQESGGHSCSGVGHSEGGETLGGSSGSSGSSGGRGNDRGNGSGDSRGDGLELEINGQDWEKAPQRVNQKTFHWWTRKADLNNNNQATQSKQESRFPQF
ncbi:uncharacterized protein SAPINGB_P004737 [Magnusiomyces paraingens]|uniref:Allantoin permease n=1 Tax=Magnusiomyces paraingens TaxID=2606893 RepID=A0A5E8C3P8_9ASCO|nr:uncharacterized protein SAPINGB_P004737 [Saprochaete ingens]VVT55785.1 unnamed protein product [Saprochaete ingens]